MCDAQMPLGDRFISTGSQEFGFILSILDLSLPCFLSEEKRAQRDSRHWAVHPECLTWVCRLPEGRVCVTVKPVVCVEDSNLKPVSGFAVFLSQTSASQGL